jgi:hypothetical protein
MLHRPEVTGARAQVLKVLATLPGTALLSPQEAALYINTTPDVLRVWRSQGKGPRYKGRGHFVRYEKDHLDGFMSGFDHRFDTRPAPRKKASPPGTTPHSIRPASAPVIPKGTIHAKNVTHKGR